MGESVVQYPHMYLHDLRRKQLSIDGYYNAHNESLRAEEYHNMNLHHWWGGGPERLTGEDPF